MTGRILLAEDDRNLGFLIKDQLVQRGFKVDWKMDGNDAIETFDKGKFDLCLLDVMLPIADGFSIARTIRKKDPDIPIIFLTARDMIEDKLEGFKSGADDYLTKPFSMEELVHRLKVFLSRPRKNNLKEEIQHYSFRDIQIYFAKHSLMLGEKEQTLTQRESDLLKLLTLNKDRILKREEILKLIWGDDDYFMGRSLDVFITRIRKYFKKSPVEIKNYHGVGFRWHEKED